MPSPTPKLCVSRHGGTPKRAMTLATEQSEARQLALALRLAKRCEADMALAEDSKQIHGGLAPISRNLKKREPRFRMLKRSGGPKVPRKNVRVVVDRVIGRLQRALRRHLLRKRARSSTTMRCCGKEFMDVFSGHTNVFSSRNEDELEVSFAGKNVEEVGGMLAPIFDVHHAWFLRRWHGDDGDDERDCAFVETDPSVKQKTFMTFKWKTSSIAHNDHSGALRKSTVSKLTRAGTMGAAMARPAQQQDACADREACAAALDAGSNCAVFKIGVCCRMTRDVHFQGSVSAQSVKIHTRCAEDARCAFVLCHILNAFGARVFDQSLHACTKNFKQTGKCEQIQCPLCGAHQHSATMQFAARPRRAPCWPVLARQGRVQKCTRWTRPSGAQRVATWQSEKLTHFAEVSQEFRASRHGSVKSHVATWQSEKPCVVAPATTIQTQLIRTQKSNTSDPPPRHADRSVSPIPKHAACLDEEFKDNSPAAAVLHANGFNAASHHRTAPAAMQAKQVQTINKDIDSMPTPTQAMNAQTEGATIVWSVMTTKRVLAFVMWFCSSSVWQSVLDACWGDKVSWQVWHFGPAWASAKVVSEFGILAPLGLQLIRPIEFAAAARQRIERLSREMAQPQCPNGIAHNVQQIVIAIEMDKCLRALQIGFHSGKIFFAPPEPPMTPIDTAVDAAVAFTKDPTDSKAVQHALSALTPNPIFCELLRRGVEKAADARMFRALRSMLIEAIPEGQPRQADVSATNLQLWRTFFAADNGNSLPVDDADAVKSPSADSERGQQMQPEVRIESTNDINKFDGSRGKCARWWKKVGKTSESTCPGFDSKEKNQWSPVIRGCLQGCQAGCERLEQCEDREPKSIGTADELDVHLLMEKFVKSCDRNSKDHLLQEWRAPSQNDRELVDDFKTRFFELVADPKEQGHVIPPGQLHDCFGDVCKESATLRIKKKEITDVDAAVDHIAEIEANAVKGTSKGPCNVPRSDRAGGNEGAKETFTDRKGKVRCTCCCGLKHGQSQCHRRKKGKPEMTLKERIDSEDQRDKRRNGHNGRKGNLRGNSNNVSQVLQQQVEKQGKAMNTLLTMLGGGEETPQEPTLQDARSVLHAASPCEAAGPPPDAANVPHVDPVPSAENCKPASAPTPTPSPQSANSLHGSRKVSMTNVGLRNSKGQFDAFAALWDSGAMPESHVNLHTVKALGLQRLVKVHRENHKNAQDQSTFSTIGSIELEVNLNGEVVPCTFKVAPVRVNIVLGQGFLEPVGGVINVVNHTVTCLRSSRRVQQPMIEASEWRSVGNIGAKDHTNSLPPPEEHRKMHPGKNLRQTAEILERTPPSDDLTVEQGREHVKHLLDAKCESIAVPRTSPSPCIRPARLRLEEGHEDVVVDVPPRPRLDRDWDRIENQGGDFKLRSEDRRDLSVRKEKHGLVHQVSDAHAEVRTKDAQRMHVPARSRRSLLHSLHLPDHQGEHTLVRRLQPHCVPDKQECVREFLKHCTCCTSEPQTLLRRESPKSKQQSVVQADKHLDVVQLDVHSHGDQNCLTFADVKTKRVWVRKLLKKGAAKKNKGAHKRKTLEQHVIWESSLGQMPKQLRMDDEDALIAVPHKNIRAHPACRPQNNGITERAHQEIARLCRSMNSTPDKACKHLRVNLEPLKPVFEAGGGEECKMKCGLASKQAQPSANIATASACDGRTLEPGSLVLVKVHSRSRKKSDPAWAGPFEVQSRASTKSCFLKRNDRLSHRHVDDVKPFSLADETFKDSKVDPVVFEKGKSYLGKMPKSFDVKCENLNADCSRDWKGETVWLGCPGGEELERVVSKLKLRGFKSAVLVVPEVPFRNWHTTLEGIRNARWCGVEPGDEHQFWVDSSGRPHCKPPVAWWVVRTAGKG
eukprot:jgi/Bigna1/90392/estExt_fgenesh1_pg.C_690051